jgi:hypothetical protein
MRDTGRDTGAVQPWQEIPGELKADRTFSSVRAEAERRITQRPYTFRDLGDFGLFLTSDNRSQESTPVAPRRDAGRVPRHPYPAIRHVAAEHLLLQLPWLNPELAAGR